MRLLLRIVFILLVACESQLERIIINTKSNEKAYNFFPLKTNYLEFSVKAKTDIHIILTNSYSVDMSYYEIVIGGWGNTRCVIRRDGIGIVTSFNGSLIKEHQFQSYWVSINDTEGSILVGMEHNKPVMGYKDVHYVKKSYFGIANGFGSSGIWNFDYEMLKCYSFAY